MEHLDIFCPPYTNNNEIYFNNYLYEGKSFGFSTNKNENKNSYTFFHDLKLTKGEKSWKVKELEVYKIIYI